MTTTAIGQCTANISEVRTAINKACMEGKRIGCVPTMGALHAGHRSLMRECRRHADFVCTTIFVNPTQFAPTEDLAKYPRPIQLDIEACIAEGVELIFMPEIPSMYPAGFQTWVSVDEITQSLEGAFRPAHFRGVTTIVAKLFNIVRPDVACFGAKDYQQLATIRRMVRDLDMPVEIITCPTIREPDGLAMSSRNIYLSPTERTAALSISQSLRMAEQSLLAGGTDLVMVQKEMVAHMESHPEIKVQYAVIADPDSLQELSAAQPDMVLLIAATVGKTRLIDNLTVTLG